MVEVVSVSQMKMIEKSADQLGVSYEQMMENAGYAAFQMMLNKVGFASRKCAVFCGNGNNGGDGLVLARYAAEAGADVTVILAGGYPKTENAIINMEKVKRNNIQILSSEFNTSAINERLSNVDIIVDAIFGTGYHGKLADESREIFKQINSAVAAVFSLDVPSGINGDTGECDEDCIEADFTITFDSIKPCHIMPESIEKCGHIEVVDIGIPELARKGLFSKASVISEAMFESMIPKRDDHGHKGTFGKVINIAGSAPYRGAAVLSSKAAAVSGAGYVTLISTPEVCQTVSYHIPEVTYIQTESDEYGCIKFPKLYNIVEIVDKANVISVGCGLGRPKEAFKFISDLLELQNTPLIIDADGINSLIGNINILHRAKCPVVITPHPGEMARLLGCTVEEVNKNRYHKVTSMAVEYGVTVVLKGHNTLIATPDGEVYINCTGNSGLSKAGSGDVLTGLIAGFAAQGMSLKEAALAGVYLHGFAAEKCSERLSKHTMQPSDIFADIGDVFNKLENKQKAENVYD